MYRNDQSNRKISCVYMTLVILFLSIGPPMHYTLTILSEDFTLYTRNNNYKSHYRTSLISFGCCRSLSYIIIVGGTIQNLTI